MSKVKIALFIMLTIVSIVCFAIAFVLLFLFLDNDNKNTALSIISLVIGLISLIFTFYSTRILFIEIRHGMICTDLMAKKGAEVIAENINSFQPNVIVYVLGNSDNLYRRYIRRFDKTNAEIKVISSMSKSCPCPYVKDEFICTNKFYLDVEILKNIGRDERVVILDDVSKTGETVYSISSYLSKTVHIPESNILTCGFIVDKFGYSKYALPGFYYKRAEVKDNYKFPWMK